MTEPCSIPHLNLQINHSFIQYVGRLILYMTVWHSEHFFFDVLEFENGVNI